MISCLFCDTSSYPDDAEYGGDRVGRQKRCKGVLRLDKLLKHIKDKHPESIPAEGRSLLAMGFTRTGGDDRPNSPEMSAGDDIVPTAPDLSSVDVAVGIPELSPHIAARNTPRLESIAPGPADLTAAAQTGVGMGQSFWRTLTRSLDGVIKSKSTAQVIPSAEAIATEVLRQQQLQRIEQNGTISMICN
jgi:hypothetical protein